MGRLFRHVRANGDNTRTAAIHHDGSGFVVTLWTADTDRIVERGRFEAPGPSYLPESKAAPAAAKARAAELVAA